MRSACMKVQRMLRYLGVCRDLKGSSLTQGGVFRRHWECNWGIHLSPGLGTGSAQLWGRASQEHPD